MDKIHALKEEIKLKYTRYKRFARLPMWGAILSTVALFFVFINGPRSYTIAFSPIGFISLLAANNGISGEINYLLTLACGLVINLIVAFAGYLAFKGRLYGLIASLIYYLFDTIAYFYLDFEYLNSGIYDYIFGLSFRFGVLIMSVIALFLYLKINNLVQKHR